MKSWPVQAELSICQETKWQYYISGIPFLYSFLLSDILSFEFLLSHKTQDSSFCFSYSWDSCFYLDSMSLYFSLIGLPNTDWMILNLILYVFSLKEVSVLCWQLCNIWKQASYVLPSFLIYCGSESSIPVTIPLPEKQLSYLMNPILFSNIYYYTLPK